MHVTNDQFLDKFNNGWKNFKMADLLWFLYITSIILPCGRNHNFKFNYGGGLLSSVLLLYICDRKNSNLIYGGMI